MPHWSSLGRLKRSRFPNLGGGGHAFGGGAGPGALSAVAGRLLCDTYLSARDLVKEVDYTLTTLARSLLKQDRAELAPSDVPGAPFMKYLPAGGGRAGGQSGTLAAPAVSAAPAPRLMRILGCPVNPCALPFNVFCLPHPPAPTQPVHGTIHDRRPSQLKC